MTAAGPDAATRLVDVLERRRQDDQQATFTTGQVLAVASSRVTVDVAGDTVSVPYLSGYSPIVGDAVVLGGAPGWWVALGAVSGAPAPAEYRLSAPYTNLGAGDYLITGQFEPVTDDDGLLDTSRGFLRLVAPRPGRYEVEWVWHSTVVPIAAKVHLNLPAGTGAVAAAVGHSLMTGSQGSGESVCRIHQSAVLAEGDALSFGLWSGGAFSMPVTTFGLARTRFAMRWVGAR